jgi:fibronectin type 3 domain-containing protein
VPAGVVPIPGPDYIALSWKANPERDLAGYKVWRKAEGEAEYALLTPDPLLANTFTDTAVEKNKRYEYAISAVDRAGNESPRSEAVSDSLKGRPDESL